MNTRIVANQTTAIIYLTIMIALTASSIISNAQSLRPNAKNTYKGLYVSFGTSSFNINSDIQHISNSKVATAGGQFGVVYGNDIFRSKIGILGYYSSVSQTAGTIDMYESNATVNFYPLSLISKRKFKVAPYIIGGLAYNKIKFNGHYLDSDVSKVNYSLSTEPYLGALNQVNALVGTGLELIIFDRYDFVHLFAEVKYGYNATNKATDIRFQNTTTNNNMQLAIGVSFGAHR